MNPTDPADGDLPFLGAVRAAVHRAGRRAAHLAGGARLLPPHPAPHPPPEAVQLLAAHEPGEEEEGAAFLPPSAAPPPPLITLPCALQKIHRALNMGAEEQRRQKLSLEQR